VICKSDLSCSFDCWVFNSLHCRIVWCLYDSIGVSDVIFGVLSMVAFLVTIT
jgi:hypothetical protein